MGEVALDDQALPVDSRVLEGVTFDEAAVAAAIAVRGYCSAVSSECFVIPWDAVGLVMEF